MKSMKKFESSNTATRHYMTDHSICFHDLKAPRPDVTNRNCSQNARLSRNIKLDQTDYPAAATSEPFSTLTSQRPATLVQDRLRPTLVQDRLRPTLVQDRLRPDCRQVDCGSELYDSHGIHQPLGFSSNLEECDHDSSNFQ